MFRLSPRDRRLALKVVAKNSFAVVGRLNRQVYGTSSLERIGAVIKEETEIAASNQRYIIENVVSPALINYRLLWYLHPYDVEIGSAKCAGGLFWLVLCKSHDIKPHHNFLLHCK